jgi:GNAT superfamily N-acetyltransferase
MNAVRRIEIGEAELYRRIRLAALKDAPEAFTTTYEAAAARPAETWQRQADEAATGNDRAIFFASSNGETVGLVALCRDGDHPDLGELFQMWVAPSFRGKGTAKQLIDAAADWARKSEFKMVKAAATKGNSRAVAFYSKCGFSQTTSDPQLPLQEFILEL